METKFQDHTFKAIKNTIHWRLEQADTYSAVDFLQFSKPVVALFPLRGRLCVVLEDGSVNRLDGFDSWSDRDEERRYEAVCVTRVDWI